MKKLAVVSGAIVLMFGAGIAWAAWTATGSGSGYAKAKVAAALTTLDVSASTTASLFPGGSGDVKIEISNPNPYGVDVTSINGSGTITSGNALCDASNSVTFTNTTGTFHVNASSSATFTLAGKASMSNASVDDCQGLVFTIPVTLSGVSAP